MKRWSCFAFALFLLTVTPLWSQVNNPSQASGLDVLAPASTDDEMKVPPPVSGQSYATQVTSEERSNYIRGGVTFTAAYTDNALGSVTGTPESDVNYSIGPNVVLDLTRSRVRFDLTYAPGFTFYQRTSSRNEADQNLSFALRYRLSPHVTFVAQDSLLKTSNVLNQQNLVSGVGVYGGAQQPNFSVIAPVADVLSNSGSAGINYQFALNGMIGASGSFTNLHYPNPNEVPGLFDSSSQGGTAFYSLRLSKMNYVGVTYQYQRLRAYPSWGLSETQAHAALFYYTLYAKTSLSLSFFAGPQHSQTFEPAQPPLLTEPSTLSKWTPAFGASLNWQGRENNFALSYSRVISSGAGLVGAAQTSQASAAYHQQFTRTLSASLVAAYTENDVLTAAVAGNYNGHSMSGSASVQKQIGPHLDFQLGYMRLHQVYNSVAILAATPDTNREFVSISYRFSRPLGR
jgi:hypothetical protein